MKIYLSAIFTLLITASTFSVQAQDQAYDLDETYGIATDGTVHLSSDGAEVKITGSDRRDVHVKVYYRLDVKGLEFSSPEEFRMDITQRNGDLYIEESDRNESGFMIGNIEEEYRITIEMPRNVSLDINGDDGSAEIAELAGAIALNVDDSDIILNKLLGSRFDINADDTDLEMSGGEGDLTVNLDDSDLVIAEGRFSRIEANGDDSDMEISTILVDDGRYSFDIEDSDLWFNILEGGGRFAIEHEDTDIDVGPEFKQELQSETASTYQLEGGTAKVVVNGEDSDIELSKN